jgi:hypothetical protein
MWIVLNRKKDTSDGPGWAFALNISLLYLGTLNYLLDWNFVGYGMYSLKYLLNAWVVSPSFSKQPFSFIEKVLPILFFIFCSKHVSFL